MLALASATATATAFAAPSCSPDAPTLVISHAGSLTSSFLPVEAAFTARTGICVVDLSGGSVKLARELRENASAVDIFASADAEVNERILRPAGLVKHVIRFSEGAMVLAYSSASRHAESIAPARNANTSDAVPAVAPNWPALLASSGVVIGGSHPFLDPGGYRADMVLQLAQLSTGKPGLYNELLSRYVIARPGDVLGKSYDYQFTYEHSARAAMAADKSGTYRYAHLPSAVSMGSAAVNYSAAGVIMPGVDGPDSLPIRIPASRVTWGLSILENARNRGAAEKFLLLFFSPEGVALRANGPTAIDPPVAAAADLQQLPAALRGVVRPLSSDIK